MGISQQSCRQNQQEMAAARTESHFTHLSSSGCYFQGRFMKNIRHHWAAGAILASCWLSGCASITGSEMQSLSLTASNEDGRPVDKAECMLDNDKGHWTATTPSFVTVHRSSQDLTVVCRKEGMLDGMLKAVSRAAGSMFGNIIFGGGIGAIIDHNKGNGYNYPDLLPVKMGGSVVIDRKEQGSTQNNVKQDSTS